MENKAKPCKGINKAKGFDGCGKNSMYRKHGLCPTCQYEWMMEDERGKIYKAKVFDIEVKQQTIKRKKQDHKKEKEKFVKWKDKLQDEINKIIRLIDKGLPCLARKKLGQIHAGHVFSRGSNLTIRYNLHNIHRQNAQSNHFQNDDGLLREGLINEYGAEYFDFISDLRRTPSLTFNNSEFQELTIKAREIVRELKSIDKEYSLKERINMRNDINLRLGIYEKEYLIYNYERN